MSTEAKSRPVLRPAGNVARQDSRGVNSRKPTNKKPPASPPLKPSSALSVKISPPNSLPTTPRASILKSPSVVKPVSSLKVISTKPSTPPARNKPNSPPDSPSLHLRHRRTSPHPPQLQSQGSPASSPTIAASLDNSTVIDQAPVGSCNHVPDGSKQVMCTTLSESDGSEPTPASSNDALNFTDDLRNSDDGILAEVNSPCVALHSKTISSAESAAPQKKSNRHSSLSRSTSDNFHRRYGKGNSSSSPSSIPIGFHSLDDASLAQLVAAKKAAASDLSVQRKLRVSEYGRKPAKAGRVAPDVPTLISANAEPQRCKFITAQSDPLYVAYHDEEWGVGVHDDRSLFELLVLAGAQVELSWTMILHKRELYRNVFCGFDPAVVASFKEKHIRSLEADKTLQLQDAKIRGVVENAQRVLEVVEEFGSLDTYFWSFLNYKPMINDFRYPKQLPAKTSKSEFISKDLVRRGFRFVGPTIVYSFMQAAGMTNDHLEVESELAVLHVGTAQSGSSLLLHELELQTHHIGQNFTHADVVHIEAY
ncbi:hypothetical protein GOP47_0012634 [Adiantum capillus-veneris]|uniref:DNA-3-methyladenine glycosylase I n=1 Tax=Adiantum capillus-veneris TaxID=13818 RepID=A0A9D4USF0_ADICA|nr:hypothetical protein GOP47_0012634 [Adiantum capillus-veneris]